MKIVIATRNPGKLKEIQTILTAPGLEIVSLRDYPNCPEVVEDGATYLDNARKKAQAVAEHCGTWALADDSGLEVEALQGRPGVLSARYAGEGASDAENNRKLLEELQGVEEARRGAAFRCVLVLRHPDGREFFSEGVLKGKIALETRGDGGFGYDPLFIRSDTGLSLAQIPSEEKNKISHRRLALERMEGIIEREILNR